MVSVQGRNKPIENRRFAEAQRSEKYNFTVMRRGKSPICVYFTNKIVTAKSKKSKKEKEGFFSKTFLACELPVRFDFAGIHAGALNPLGGCVPSCGKPDR
jgi:hypothetical protein